MLKIILIASIAIQALAVISALRYIKKAPGIALLFIGIGLSLMACRRVLSLVGIPLGTEISEILGLIISLLLFLGVLYGSKIFKVFEKNVAYIKTIWNMDRIMLTASSPQTLVNAMKRFIAEVFDCDALAIYNVDIGCRGYSLYTNHNLPIEFHNQAIIDNDFFKQIVDTRKISILDKIPLDANVGFSGILKKSGFESCIGIPLLSKGYPHWILILLSTNKREYSKDDIRHIEGLSRQLSLAIEKVEAMKRIKEMGVESVLALVQAIEMRDCYTKGHSVQVADLAVEIARLMDFSDYKLEMVKFAGLLHDVGKIAIPETILQKPAALTEEEWAIVKRHPIQSVNIIKPIKDLKEIEAWILYHHERWDGSGYPDGLKGSKIPLEARILAICDTYSAIVGDRPYRKGLQIEYAKEEIRRFAGKQFDPGIVKIFLSIPENFLKELISKTGGSL